jgi:hypothetical protein
MSHLAFRLGHKCLQATADRLDSADLIGLLPVRSLDSFTKQLAKFAN